MTKSSPMRGIVAAASLVVLACMTGTSTIKSADQSAITEKHTHFARLTSGTTVPQNAALSQQDDHYLPDVCKQGTYQWTANRLPVKVFISTGENVTGYRPQFNDMVRISFDQWCEASGNKLSWKEVADRSAADVTVDWTTKVKQIATGTEAGETNALTRLNTVTQQGVIYGARMHFLTQLNGKDFNDTEIQRTCLHEAGHALGLQGHSPDRRDVMYYAISKNQQPVLSVRDRATMSRLYSHAPANDEIALGKK